MRRPDMNAWGPAFVASLLFCFIAGFLVMIIHDAYYSGKLPWVIGAFAFFAVTVTVLRYTVFRRGLR